MKKQKNKNQQKQAEKKEQITQTESNLTRWHIILGDMLEKLLSPVNITVETDFPVMSKPPRGDILLIRRDTPQWTRQQLELLPDGIRDTKADYILVEFKCTESVNKKAITQAVAYDFFYRNVQESLDDSRIQTFILSSITPQKKIRERAGYTQQIMPGVFKSINFMVEPVQLISINDLSDSAHNQYIKCFASKKKEKEKAFEELIETENIDTNAELFFIFSGLWNIFNKKHKGAEIMEKRGYTPEDVMNIGKEMHEFFMASLKVDDVIKRFSPEDILSKFEPEKRLSGLKPEERLSGLKPEERLSGLSIKEIESFLEKKKKNEN